MLVKLIHLAIVLTTLIAASEAYVTDAAIHHQTLAAITSADY